jgi:hypothetical protein
VAQLAVAFLPWLPLDIDRLNAVGGGAIDDLSNYQKWANDLDLAKPMEPGIPAERWKRAGPAAQAPHLLTT